MQLHLGILGELANKITYMENTNTTIIIIAIVLAIGLFGILRFFFLWYFRIDEIVANQKINNQLLSNQNTLLEEIIAKGKV